MSEMRDSSQQVQEMPPASDAKSSWLIPTVTGLAGFALGAVLVGGVWMVSSASSFSAHQAAAAKAKAAAAQAETARKSILKNALAECGLTDDEDSQLGDSGYTLTVDGQGDDDYSGLSVGDESCLLQSVAAPSAVLSHIDQTTAMDGRQTEAWGNVTFSWSYHPDRGLDGVFSIAKR